MEGEREIKEGEDVFSEKQGLAVPASCIPSFASKAMVQSQQAAAGQMRIMALA